MVNIGRRGLVNPRRRLTTFPTTCSLSVVFSVAARSRRATDAPTPRAMLVPVAEITAPVRKLNPDALRSLLRGVRDGDDLPARGRVSWARCGRRRAAVGAPYVALDLRGV